MYALASRASERWTVPVSLGDVPPKEFYTATSYTVAALVQWHTGPLVAGGQLTTVEAEGEGQITLAK